MLRGADVVVAHNADFDMRMLAKEGIRIPKSKIRDTMKIAKKKGVYGGKDGKVSLKEMKKHFGIRSRDRAHSAFGNAWVTYMGYMKMI